MDEIFVPGRLCLFGEHSDWAGGHRRSRPELSPGHCLVTGTDQGIRARFEPIDDALEISSRVADGRSFGPERIPLADLAGMAGRDSFLRYAAGVAAEMVSEHGPRGLRIELESDLPVGRGLSSSAAVCVAVARAFAMAHDLPSDARREMELAYRGERRTGSACGRMDQVCALGQRLTALRFDGDDLEIEPFESGGAFYLLVIDLCREKDTRRILSDLDACFPDSPGALARGVREALGPRNAELIARARAALEAGDATALGELMREAQAVFDQLVAPACGELAAPKLHEVLDHPATRELALGGKGVGSQGDGCAQLLSRGPEERDALQRRLESELDVLGIPLTIEPRAAS